MAERLGIYKCSICGNMAEVIHAGTAEMFCCGQPMQHLAAKTADQGKEKHVPVIEKIDGGIKVKVGSVPHPMVEEHYIEWVEILVDGKAYRQFLSPGQSPEAVFNMAPDGVKAREFCNVHGLWEAGNA